MRTAIVGVVAVATVACGGGAAVDPLAGVPADAPVAVLDLAGGFVPVEHRLARLPRLVVYADGTVLAARAGDGALDELVLTGEELSDLAVFLDDADLERFPETVEPDGPVTVADAPTTTIEVRLTSGTHRVSAYALGFEGLDYPEVLEDVTERLEALAARVRSDGEVWTPARGRLMVTGPAGSGGAQLADPWPETWPVPDRLSSATPHQPASAVVAGAGVEQALVAFAQAPVRRFVAPDGQAYLVAWRPLLPHEDA